MMRYAQPLARATAVAMVLLGGMSTHADAQTWVRSDRTVLPEAPGWIGISFDPTGEGRAGSTLLMITEVSPGSPAEDAGIQPGDRLLAINELHTARELGSLSERLHLSAGDPVLVEVERDGRRIRHELRAAPLPERVMTGRTVELSLGADSMVETWVRAMDSLRFEIVTGGGQNVRVQRAPPSGGRIRVVTGSSERSTVRAPFDFFVFRGESRDSLREEMVELNEILAELDGRIREREREFRRTSRPDTEVPLSEDIEFRRLSAALDAATVRSERLEIAMAEAARATAGLQYTRATPGVGSVATPPAPDRTEFRPPRPYLVGQNRVAEAEVVDVKPEMAPYFQVQGGVLVTDVAAGTPASMAGLVPGDVITRLGQVAVRSVEDFRFGVSRAGETLPITLVRQGRTVQILLRR